MGVKNAEELKPQTVTLVNEVEEEEDDEIDLGALFYRFLEKIHWIIICAVIGAANIDIGGFPAGRLSMRDSNPGRVRLSAGGVGRNIACNLARLGVETHLIAALGGDPFANMARADCARAGVRTDLAFEFPDAGSSVYLFIADADGDMQLAVNDMDICRRLTPEALESRIDALNAMDAVVLDANLSAEALEFLADRVTVPLLADAVSAAKAPRLLNVLPRLRALKPNAIGATDNTVNTWMEFLQLTTAQPLATVEHPFLGQWPCISENQYGKGHLIYIGTLPSTDVLYKLIARAAQRKAIATVERQYQFPIVLRSGTNAKGRKIHYLFNYSYEPKTVTWPYPASESLLDKQTLAGGRSITIEPWGVVIGEER